MRLGTLRGEKVLVLQKCRCRHHNGLACSRWLPFKFKSSSNVSILFWLGGRRRAERGVGLPRPDARCRASVVGVGAPQGRSCHERTGKAAHQQQTGRYNCAVASQAAIDPTQVCEDLQIGGQDRTSTHRSRSTYWLQWMPLNGGTPSTAAHE